MLDRIHYQLLQVRNPGDPMREQEIHAFARALGTVPERISVFDLLIHTPDVLDLAAADMFILGGSGHYSVVYDVAWLDYAFETLRRVYDSGKPVFASCWGFQAMARAMGGRVINDLATAEIGTHTLRLTEAGLADPVFGPLGPVFKAQMGHEDRVVELPPGAVLLASSDRVENQAYKFEDRPIYCTQFHPELNRADLFDRVQAYPQYVSRIAGLPPERFPELVEETPEAEALLKRFVRHVFGEAPVGR